MKANNLKFNDVYEKHYKSVMNYVRARVHNPEIAEEIAQETFVRVSKHLPEFDSKKAQLNTWLFTITNRLMIDHFRSDKSGLQMNVSDFTDETGKETFQFEADTSADSHIVNAELKAKIEKCMDTLKPQHKRIVEMYMIEDRQYKEIAELLKLPLGTIQGTLNRAKAKLQAMLQKEYAQL